MQNTDNNHSDSPIKAPFFIEQVQADGQLISRHRFTQLPITIGRGYDNDLILDDPYIQANQVSVALDDAGRFLVQGCSGDDAITFQNTPQSECHPEAGQWQIGQTHLRLRHAGFAVSPAMFQERRSQDAANVDAQALSWQPTLLSVLAFAAATFFTLWVHGTASIDKLEIAMGLLGMFALLSLWAGAWALLTKVVGKHQAKFKTHIVIAVIASLILFVWPWVSGALAYALSLPVLTQYSMHVIVLVSAVMIYWHLKTVKPALAVRSLPIVASLAVLVSALLIWNNVENYGKAADEQFMSDLFPPSIRLTANQPADDFIDTAKVFKAGLDAASKEAIEELEAY